MKRRKKGEVWLSRWTSSRTRTHKTNPRTHDYDHVNSTQRHTTAPHIIPHDLQRHITEICMANSILLAFGTHPTYTRPRSRADRRPDMLRIFSIWVVLTALIVVIISSTIFPWRPTGETLQEAIWFLASHACTKVYSPLSSIDCRAARTIPISIFFCFSHLLGRLMLECLPHVDWDIHVGF